VIRGVASRAAQTALAAYVPARTVRWPDASRLFVVGDRLGWSIDDDSVRLSATALRLGYEVAPSSWARHAARQAVFHPEHFGALRPRWLESSHKLGLSYFHGRPGTAGYPEFDEAFEALRGHARRFDRIQVTHDEMHELMLGAGVPEERVFKIPIGVDIGRFPLGDHAARTAARGVLGLPQDAFVVGSFQKDGVGLRAGLQPKLVKGPDTLIATLARLKDSVAELHVLLTGRARGYVRTELGRLGIPYVHHELASRNELARAYHALDAYIVTSRQEGGPKAVLEAMATGAPLVTTRVGQVPDVVIHGDNGLIVDIDDVDGLVAAVQELHDDSQLATHLREAGRPTAEAFADAQLDDRWAALFDGFVSRKDAHAG
jgi:glycosyltransferase involved in cell wall biosynthesis